MLDRICIGTMLWGTRTTEIQANEMIRIALDNGIEFFDTADSYPTFPYSQETFGLSEKILGRWIKSNGRNGVRVSTKMRPTDDIASIRGAVEASLTRLNVDRIDYYQLHWPARGSYCFRKNWDYDPSSQSTSDVLIKMEATLDVLSRLVDEGKISSLGMSNETAWGVTMWNQIARKHGYHKLAFVQNEYSLLCRLFDLDMAEACHHEDVKLLAWTPLAGGLLTGKYGECVTPIGSRRSYKALGERDNEKVWSAIEGYRSIAVDAGIDMIHMSLAWILSRPFTWAIIVGATTPEQLKHNLGFTRLTLDGNVLRSIEKVHRLHPLPF